MGQILVKYIKCKDFATTKLESAKVQSGFEHILLEGPRELSLRSELTIPKILISRLAMNENGGFLGGKAAEYFDSVFIKKSMYMHSMNKVK